MIRIDDVYRAIDRVAPFALSDKFTALTGGYDNSGILLRACENADAVLFTLDLSAPSLAAAKEAGAQCIVTHHPAIYRGIRRMDAREPKGADLIGAAAAGISVISAHLNADVAKFGVDWGLADGLGAKKQEVLTRVDGGLGYGRAFRVEEQTLDAFAARIRREFRTDKLFVYGDAGRKIRSVASFCGAGGDEEDVLLAAGCDVIVSADFPHHVVLEAVGRGLAVVEMTHYASENYGFQKLYRQIKDEIGGAAKCVYFTDERLL